MKNNDDPVLKRIKSLLNEHGPKELRGRYGTGDPGIINKSQLAQPMAFVSYEDQGFDMSASHELGSEMPIVIDVVHDMTKDFGQGLNATSHLAVVDLACGRNKDFSLRDDSIVGVLRNHQDMSQTEDNLQLFLDVGKKTTVEFDYQNRDKGLVTAEARIKFTLTTEQILY